MRISDWSSDVCSSDLAVTLAEGALYSNDPAYYKTELARMAKATPAEVKAVANKWLSRPAFSLTYVPGERTEGGEARGGPVRANKARAEVAPDRYWNPAHGDVGPDTGEDRQSVVWGQSVSERLDMGG